jgi:hypothetical protein
MLIKPSIILAAAVLAAASSLSPFARADGTDPLMPTGTTFDPQPRRPKFAHQPGIGLRDRQGRNPGANEDPEDHE